jgi:anti-sigma factor RsiW
VTVDDVGAVGSRIACRNLVELLTDYLEGVLVPPTLTEVEAHLATCPPCQAYLGQVRTTVDALGRVEATEQLCDDAREDVLGAFRSLTLSGPGRSAEGRPAPRSRGPGRWPWTGRGPRRPGAGRS